MSIRVGIVGVSGYGGGEALRLCITHPTFKLTYVSVRSANGHNVIPFLDFLGELSLIFCFLLLRPDHKKIKDQNDGAEENKLENLSATTGCRL